MVQRAARVFKQMGPFVCMENPGRPGEALPGCGGGNGALERVPAKWEGDGVRMGEGILVVGVTCNGDWRIAPCRVLDDPAAILGKFEAHGVRAGPVGVGNGLVRGSRWDLGKGFHIFSF